MTDKKFMKTILLLLILVSCGKEPGKTANSQKANRYIASSPPTICIGSTRQQCFKKCTDHISDSLNDCANAIDQAERTCRLGAIEYEKECTEAVLNLPKTDDIIN